MDQPTFADLEYQGKKRKARRELFLERMDDLIPWQLLDDRIRPCYSKTGGGRHPYPLSVMLRVHCVKHFYNLSDPGMEDLLYESDPVRRFTGLKLSGPLPDETTILNFRNLLEKDRLVRVSLLTLPPDPKRCPAEFSPLPRDIVYRTIVLIQEPLNSPIALSQSKTNNERACYTTLQNVTPSREGLRMRQ